MKKTSSLLVFFFFGCVLSLFSGMTFAAGLLPGGYDPSKLPKPLPYTYNGTTYTHAIVWPHTGSDHWVAYYNGNLTWSWPSFLLPENNACFYQASPNGPTSGNPNAGCSGASILFNNCTKTYYSDVDLRAGSSMILYGTGGSCNNINYSTNALLIEGTPYTVTTSLKWPLTGTFASRTVGWGFGATWTYGQCPSDTYKKHAGVDVNATASEAVYAAHDGVVKKIFTGQHSTWADAIVVEDLSGQFTTVYWHVSAYSGVNENNTVARGQQIATVADLGAGTHFHFGIRTGSYSDPESYAGALPVANGCSYLAFPENFIDPAEMTYQ